ncbi:MAG: response regulator transcription factor [Aureispira sp.]|nr:response regulator transcription factor [Aureispira sp.]
MEKIKAIVVDDERWARTVLTKLLEQNCPTVEIVATCVDLVSAVEQIKLLEPDVVFLDVKMPDYAGYEIINFFTKINFSLIFVTAFDQYAIKAFELNAVDYLVKPIDRKKLVMAVDKLTTKLEKENYLESYEELLKTIKSKGFKKIILPELGNRRIIDLSSILAIKADDTYCKVYLKEGKTITISKTLKHFEELLDDNASFFRSHRSWIVNLEHVQQFNKTDNTIVINDNLKAAISRKKFEEFELAIK